MIHTHTRSIRHKVYDAWRSPDRFTKNPDIVQLSSGRLLLVYSDNDQHWSQVNQVLTVLASDDLGRTWSHHAVVDQARTWSEHQETAISGFEPDRMMELPDGSLAVATHVMRGESQEFADILTCSNR